MKQATHIGQSFGDRHDWACIESVIHLRMEKYVWLGITQLRLILFSQIALSWMLVLDSIMIMANSMHPKLSLISLLVTVSILGGSTSLTVRKHMSVRDGFWSCCMHPYLWVFHSWCLCFIPGQVENGCLLLPCVQYMCYKMSIWWLGCREYQERFDWMGRLQLICYSGQWRKWKLRINNLLRIFFMLGAGSVITQWQTLHISIWIDQFVQEASRPSTLDVQSYTTVFGARGESTHIAIWML